MYFKKYSQGSQVGHWQGWIENAQGTVIGFVKGSGEITFSW